MLLSQSLFIDHEYKIDCEKKIDYLSILNKDISGLTLKNDRLSITENFSIPDGKNIVNRTKEITLSNDKSENVFKKLIEEY